MNLFSPVLITSVPLAPAVGWPAHLTRSSPPVTTSLYKHLLLPGTTPRDLTNGPYPFPEYLSPFCPTINFCFHLVAPTTQLFPHSTIWTLEVEINVRVRPECPRWPTDATHCRPTEPWQWRGSQRSARASASCTSRRVAWRRPRPPSPPSSDTARRCSPPGSTW